MRLATVTQLTFSRSRLTLISRIYAFIRHPISSVRLAVAKVLHVFITVPDLPRDDWVCAELFSLLFQNLVLEERTDIREITISAFNAAVEEVDGEAGALDITVETSLEDWYEMVMTPIGVPLDPKLFVGKARTGHNVDKPIMAGDTSLVTTDTVLRTRIAAAKALALLRRCQLEVVSLLDCSQLTDRYPISTSYSAISDRQVPIRSSWPLSSFRSGHSILALEIRIPP